MPEFYYEPREITKRLNFEEKVEMSEWQSAFLCGLLKEKRPKKILEIGVSAGGTTAIVLNCMSLIDCQCEMTSVDILDYYYKDPTKKSGYLAEEVKGIIDNKVKHEMKIGIIPDLIEEIGGGIDFLILDAAHMIPGEILDFLTCLPYLTENATVVLHDVILHRTCSSVYTNATRVLMDSVTADKIIAFGDTEFGYPNIGAFVVNKDTKKYIYDVFSSLLMTWQYGLEKEEAASFRRIFVKNGYDENCIKVFDIAESLTKKTCEYIREGQTESVKIIANEISMLQGKKVYIYGAGSIGRQVRETMGSCISFLEYVVSDNQAKGDDTCFLSEITNKLDEDRIIYVAVSPEKFDSIQENLNKAGVPKDRVIFMSLKMHDYLY